MRDLEIRYNWECQGNCCPICDGFQSVLQEGVAPDRPHPDCQCEITIHDPHDTCGGNATIGDVEIVNEEFEYDKNRINYELEITIRCCDNNEEITKTLKLTVDFRDDESGRVQGYIMDFNEEFEDAILDLYEECESCPSSCS